MFNSVVPLAKADVEADVGAEAVVTLEGIADAEELVSS